MENVCATCGVETDRIHDATDTACFLLSLKEEPPPAGAVMLSIYEGADFNYGYRLTGDEFMICDTCDTRPALIFWDAAMDSCAECAHCMLKSMREDFITTILL